MKPTLKIIIFLFGVAGIFAIFYFFAIWNLGSVPTVAYITASIWILLIAFLMTYGEQPVEPPVAALDLSIYENETMVRDLIWACLVANGFKEMRKISAKDQFAGIVLRDEGLPDTFYCYIFPSSQSDPMFLDPGRELEHSI